MTKSLFIRSLEDGSIHIVRKYILDDQGIASVWSNTWYGRHVIGQDCQFSTTEELLNCLL